MIRQLCLLASFVLIPRAALADGLLYHLPNDGSWVRYDWDGNGTKPDGTNTKVSGSLSMSSVGIAEIDGKECRWIEISMGIQSEGQEFSNTYKLLIPVEHLRKGQRPLENIVKAWNKHSLVHKEPIEIKNASGTGARFLEGITPFLRGPFSNPKEEPATRIESPIGNFDCITAVASEKTEREGGITMSSEYRIAINEKVPFGVVTWEHRAHEETQGKLHLKMLTRLKVVATGNDARSTMPDSQ